MRLPAAVVAAAALLSACDAERVSGPAAGQRMVRVSGASVRQPTRVRACYFGPSAQPTSALLFLDGKEIPSSTSLDSLPGESIESVEVVKGRAAVALYGDRGSAGVVLVVTKRR